MKRLGLIGGTTWHSTAVYYRMLNEGVQAKLGGVASADLVLASVNFAEVVVNNDKADWEANDRLFAQAGVGVASAGAEGLVLCANTMHMNADAVSAATGLPIIHIVDAIAAECHRQAFAKVALLGTRFTMEMDFFRDRLAGLGVEWIIPSTADRDYIQDSIFKEMAVGVFSDSTRAEYIRIINDLKEQGAQAAVLGCTELPILLRPGDVDLPTLDTTAIHVGAALEFAL